MGDMYYIALSYPLLRQALGKAASYDSYASCYLLSTLLTLGLNSQSIVPHYADNLKR